MCNNPKGSSITLQTAVLMQVKEFAQNNVVFSIHDITRNVRDKVSAGSLEIPEVEVSGASFRFDIPHVKVKSLFLDMFNTGVFDPYFTLDREFNDAGGYWVYTPQNASSVNQTVPIVNAPSYAPTTTTYTAPAAVVAPVKTANQKVSKPTITDRVEVYLNKCTANCYRPTIKQVQSAVKRGNLSSGWTCEELAGIIKNDLGYSLDDNDLDFVSTSVVNV